MKPTFQTSRVPTLCDGGPSSGGQQMSRDGLRDDVTSRRDAGCRAAQTVLYATALVYQSIESNGTSLYMPSYHECNGAHVYMSYLTPLMIVIYDKNKYQKAAKCCTRPKKSRLNFLLINLINFLPLFTTGSMPSDLKNAIFGDSRRPLKP